MDTSEDSEIAAWMRNTNIRVFSVKSKCLSFYSAL